MYKTTGITAFLFAGLTIVSFVPFYSNDAVQRPFSRREEKIQKEVVRQIVFFQNYVKDTFLLELERDRIDSQRLRQVFLKSRLLFKRFEWAAEYFAADLTERLNGPPVQEIENADLSDPLYARAIDPVGLQVIEESLYPEFDIDSKTKLIREVNDLVTNTGYLVSYFTDHPLADWRILDAAKLEVFRIITLGISGFDAPLSMNGINECASSLQSLHKALHFYADKKKHGALLNHIADAIEYLHEHPGFDSFDRAGFIVRFANKISAGIAQLEQDLPGPKIKYNRMLRQEAGTLFDSGAFNADAFSPGPEFHLTDAKAALGEKLFYDVKLSGTGTRSCASCHNPRLAFTDGLARPRDIRDSSKLLLRNVPTLLNAALQSNYFYDMRALTLEDQARDVITNSHEMDGSMETIIKYIDDDTAYLRLFAKAFPGKKEMNEDEITNALGCYVRSLVKLNSRFDKYMRGNEDALSAKEVKGFNLFMGKAKCATCHFVPLFNGITPPKYVMSETEILGVPGSLTDSTLDPDTGYYGVIGIDSYKYAFKIPTLRNISKTAPYMHNGIYRTLDQVMDFYNNGGGAGLGIRLPNQTLSKENLHLTEKEKEDIIAFMKSLDSE